MYRVAVSRILLSRDMRALLGSAEGVRTVVFPKTVKSVSDTALQGIKSFRAVVMNEEVEELGYKANGRILRVVRNPELVHVSLPSRLRVLEPGMFSYYFKLKAIQLPAGLQTIGKYCFYESGLTQITVPGSVREILEGAFRGCEGLKSVVFERDGRLELIGEECFFKTALSQVVLPQSVRDVGDQAFGGS